MSAAKARITYPEALKKAKTFCETHLTDLNAGNLQLSIDRHFGREVLKKLKQAMTDLGVENATLAWKKIRTQGTLKQLALEETKDGVLRAKLQSEIESIKSDEKTLLGWIKEAAAVKKELSSRLNKATAALRDYRRNNIVFSERAAMVEWIWRTRDEQSSQA
jgi:hypothetical protein